MSNLVHDGNPTFVKDFKSLDAAIQAVTIMVAAREFGYTNKDIINVDFFLSLFNSDFLKKSMSHNNNKNKAYYLEIRLKNIARDLRKIEKYNLNKVWYSSKKYFEGLKRK